ncbi:MAG: hypothetical protein ILO68_01845 [Clostridia bacterium]|nr:hypothetical protein [Clostridia bacterium]
MLFLTQTQPGNPDAQKTGAGTGSKKRSTDSRGYKIFLFIASLFGAFLLWIYAMGYDSESVTETFNGIPVELTGTNASGFTVAETEFSLSIDITASGTRSELNNVTSSDFRAYVDISAVTSAGYNTLPIQVAEPPALNVTNLSTGHVTLYMDTFTSKRIPVTVEQVFTSAYTIGESRPSVTSVSVYGPETLLRNAEAYAMISLGNVTEAEASANWTLTLRDAETKAAISSPYLTMETQTVTVNYVMFMNKTVPLRLVLTGGTLTPSDIQYAFGTDSVSLTGPVSALRGLESLPVSVDETAAESGTELTFGKTELLDAAGLDARVTPSDPDTPVTLTLYVPSTKTAAVEIPASRITVVNIPHHVTASVSSGLEVYIMGAPAAIKGYDRSQMTATVDYFSFELQASSGLYVGTAVIQTGDSSVAVYGGPYQVTVSVSGA